MALDEVAWLWVGVLDEVELVGGVGRGGIARGGAGVGGTAVVGGGTGRGGVNMGGVGAGRGGTSRGGSVVGAGRGKSNVGGSGPRRPGLHERAAGIAQPNYIQSPMGATTQTDGTGQENNAPFIKSTSIPPKPTSGVRGDHGFAIRGRGGLHARGGRGGGTGVGAHRIDDRHRNGGHDSGGVLSLAGHSGSGSVWESTNYEGGSLGGQARALGGYTGTTRFHNHHGQHERSRSGGGGSGGHEPRGIHRGALSGKNRAGGVHTSSSDSIHSRQAQGEETSQGQVITNSHRPSVIPGGGAGADGWLAHRDSGWAGMAHRSQSASTVPYFSRDYACPVATGPLITYVDQRSRPRMAPITSLDTGGLNYDGVPPGSEISGDLGGGLTYDDDVPTPRVTKGTATAHDVIKLLPGKKRFIDRDAGHAAVTSQPSVVPSYWNPTDEEIKAAMLSTESVTTDGKDTKEPDTSTSQQARPVKLPRSDRPMVNEASDSLAFSTDVTRSVDTSVSQMAPGVSLPSAGSVPPHWMQPTTPIPCAEDQDGKVTEPSYVQKRVPWALDLPISFSGKQDVLYMYEFRLSRHGRRVSDLVIWSVGEGFCSRPLPAFCLGKWDDCMINNEVFRFNLTATGTAHARHVESRVRPCIALQRSAWHAVEQYATRDPALVLCLVPNLPRGVLGTAEEILRVLTATLEENVLAAEAMTHSLLRGLPIARNNVLAVVASSTSLNYKHVAYLSHLGDGIFGVGVAFLCFNKAWRTLTALDPATEWHRGSQIVYHFDDKVQLLETNAQMRISSAQAGLTRYCRRSQLGSVTVPADIQRILPLPHHTSDKASPTKHLSDQMEAVVGAMYEGHKGLTARFPYVDYVGTEEFIRRLYPEEFGLTSKMDLSDAAKHLRLDTTEEKSLRSAFLSLFGMSQLSPEEEVVFRLGFVNEADTQRSLLLRLCSHGLPELGERLYKCLQTRRVYTPLPTLRGPRAVRPKDAHNRIAPFLSPPFVAGSLRALGLAVAWGLKDEPDIILREAFLRALGALGLVCRQQPHRLGPVLIALEEAARAVFAAQDMAKQPLLGKRKREPTPDNM